MFSWGWKILDMRKVIKMIANVSYINCTYNMNQFYHLNEYDCGKVRQGGAGIGCRIQVCRTQQPSFLVQCSFSLPHRDFMIEVIEGKTSAAEMLGLLSQAQITLSDSCMLYTNTQFP